MAKIHCFPGSKARFAGFSAGQRPSPGPKMTVGAELEGVHPWVYIRGCDARG